MVSYQPVIHTTAKRELDELDKSDRDRLTDVIADVASVRQPTTHEKVTMLEGQPGVMRVRVGEVRAVLELDKPNLRVLTVGYRSHVYDGIDETVSERRATG